MKITTKKCYDCKEIKPLDYFHKHKNEIHGRKNQCKKCCAVRRKAHYANNKTKERDMNRAYKAANKENIRKYEKTYRNIKRAEYKKHLLDMMGGKCVVCGYDKCPQAIDFHHINEEEKAFTIGTAQRLSGVSLEMLENEVKKCAPLCSNCHRELHAGVYDLNDYL